MKPTSSPPADYQPYTYSVLNFTDQPDAPFVLVTRFSNPDGSESDCYATYYADADEARAQLLTHASYYDNVHGDYRDFSGNTNRRTGDTYRVLPVVQPVAIDRADVLRTTWVLVKKTGISFGKALKKAWAAIKLKASLSRTDEKGQWVDFIKTDGTTRHILATRNPAHIPAEHQPKQAGKPASPLTVAFYDLFEGAWKSCRVDSLLA